MVFCAPPKTCELYLKVRGAKGQMALQDFDNTIIQSCIYLLNGIMVFLLTFVLVVAIGKLGVADRYLFDLPRGCAAQRRQHLDHTKIVRFHKDTIESFMKYENCILLSGANHIKKSIDIPLISNEPIRFVFHDPNNTVQLIIFLMGGIPHPANVYDEILIYNTKTSECKPFVPTTINDRITGCMRTIDGQMHYYPFRSFEKQLKAKIWEQKNVSINHSRSGRLYYKLIKLDNYSNSIQGYYQLGKMINSKLLMVGCFEWETSTVDDHDHNYNYDTWEFIALFDQITMTVDFETIIVDRNLFHLRRCTTLTSVSFFGDMGNTWLLTQYLVCKKWLLLACENFIYVYYIDIRHFGMKSGNGDIGNDDNFNYSDNYNYGLFAPIFIKRIFMTVGFIRKLISLDDDLPFIDKVEYTSAFPSTYKYNIKNTNVRSSNDPEDLILLVVGDWSNSRYSYTGYRKGDKMAVYLHQSIRLIKITLNNDDIIRSKTVITDNFLREKEDSKRYDTFGLKLEKNRQFWKCFENKMLQGAQIEFVDNRYVLFVGGTLHTNRYNDNKGIWNTVSEIRFNSTDRMNNMINDIAPDSSKAIFCDETSRMMHIQSFNQWSPILIQTSEIIVFDFVNREWKFVKNITTIKNSVTTIQNVNVVNKSDFDSCLHMFGFLRDFKSKKVGLSHEDVNYNHNSMYYIKLSFETSLWVIERVIWIGYIKNESNDQCCLSKIPKDIVKYILRLAKFSIFDATNRDGFK